MLGSVLDLACSEQFPVMGCFKIG